MKFLRNFIVGCKRCCNHFLKTSNDSHKHETIVEIPMSKVPFEQNPDIQLRRENDSGNISHFDDLNGDCLDNDSAEKQDCSVVNNEITVFDETDVLLENGGEIPAEIILGKSVEDVLLNEIQSHIDVVESDEEVDMKPVVTDYQEESFNKNIILSLIELVEELDCIQRQSNDSNTTSVIEFCQNRLIETLFANGCSPMEETTFYDSKCHVVYPFAIVKNGTEIQTYIRTGVVYKEKILLKAVVKIKDAI